jgi:hypothetical protein
MAKRLAAVQSSYIPWKGYFDLMRSVDEFVLLDDAQYTRRDWRNRNVIKTRDGPRWLTIPVHSRGHYHDPIHAITLSEPEWAARHWRTIELHYRRAAGFPAHAGVLQALYETATQTHLSRVNHHFLRAIADLLGIKTPLTWSMDHRLPDGRNERLLELCVRTGATTYVSGPSARGYLDLDLFRRRGIEVEFFDYEGYPPYPQLHPPFDHRVSVVDLLLNAGVDAPRYLVRG